jgi:hypothetical protein
MRFSKNPSFGAVVYLRKNIEIIQLIKSHSKQQQNLI